MIGGVGFPSFRNRVASIEAGSAADDFPASNLRDLVNVRRIWRAAGAGSADLTVTLASALVQAVMLVHHNLPAGASVEVKRFGTGGLIDSLTTVMPAPVANYLQTAPIVFAEAAACTSVVISITGVPATVLQMGAIDVTAWWSWPDIMVEEERGFAPTTLVSQLPGGIDSITRQWAPRIQSGTRTALTAAELQTTAIDFQVQMGKSAPFVFVRDLANKTRWPREAFLAKNADVPTIPIDDQEAGPFSYRLQEHLG